NRRTFLKAAVVGTAAVAAVGGAGTAALALSGRKPASLLSFSTPQATPSPEAPCAVCTTGTVEPFQDENSFGKNSLFLWIRFINVAAGSYTIDVTPTIQPQGSSCTVSTPFSYQQNMSNVDAWVFAAGGLACHPAMLSDWASGSVTGSDFLPQSFTIATSKDLAVRVHLKGDCSGTFTVTALLKSGNTTVLSCTHDITITLK
ncbi:MAG TPA: hypothetical protein VF916_06125, partial [Ktedonobacterales bacterium]